MSEVAIDVEWPEDLPLPTDVMTGTADHPALCSPIENARIQRRARYSNNPVEASVTWMLKFNQYRDFKDFFLSDLNIGSNLFTIDLRFPLNSELTNWVVRFVGGYEAEYIDGHYEVTAQLDLIMPSDLPATSATDAYSGLYVPEDVSDPEFQEYLTSDGYHYHVTV